MIDALIEKLKNNTFITLETTPGHSPVFETTLEKIEELNLHKKIDGFSTTDNPLAKLKYNSILAAIKLQQRFSKPTIATMSMRDRNKIALQSDLLGANEFDIRAILALTGDSAKISDQPNSKGVFEGDSTLLLDIIKCFNSGIDYAGRPLVAKPKSIYPFSVMNSYAKNPKMLLKKMNKKIQHGAIGIVTQPVYDAQSIKILLDLLSDAKASNGGDAELVLGFFPITKLRTAQFLSAHVPGINVPSLWLEKLHSASKVSIEEEYRVGFELSSELLSTIMEIHPKTHIMTANQFSIASELLKNFEDR